MLTLKHTIPQTHLYDLKTCFIQGWIIDTFFCCPFAWPQEMEATRMIEVKGWPLGEIESVLLQVCDWAKLAYGFCSYLVSGVEDSEVS